MGWKNNLATKFPWDTQISNAEEKQVVADKLAAMVEDGQVIGAGSGSTSFLALKAIAKKIHDKGLNCLIIPTSKEIEMSAGILGLKTSTLISVKPDWYFDGADEVDNEGNLIKGRGGAMYREKLVMVSSKRTFILVDQSKFVEALGEKFLIPVEVQQEALHYTQESLTNLGADVITMRLAVNKDGPVITESGNFILDCKFNAVDGKLEKNIKSITGIVESGLFWGYKPEILSN